MENSPPEKTATFPSLSILVPVISHLEHNTCKDSPLSNLHTHRDTHTQTHTHTLTQTHTHTHTQKHTHTHTHSHTPHETHNQCACSCTAVKGEYQRRIQRLPLFRYSVLCWIPLVRSKIISAPTNATSNRGPNSIRHYLLTSQHPDLPFSPKPKGNAGVGKETPSINKPFVFQHDRGDHPSQGETGETTPVLRWHL